MSSAEVQVTVTIVQGSGKGKSFRLDKSSTTIGRRGTDIKLSDRKVSTKHASIEINGDKVVIRDLNSRNGILVNGNRVTDAELQNLDEVDLGLTKFKILIVEDLASFKERNLAEASKEEADGGDIGGMISDELKRFLKWDLSGPESEPVERSFAGSIPFVLKIVSGPDTGRVIQLTKRTLTIGRSKADITLNDRDVSRLHAALEITGDRQITIRDLGSTNGILINEEKVAEARLCVDDQIEIGSTILCLAQEDS